MSRPSHCAFKCLAIMGAVVLFFIVPHHALGAGFAIIEQSVGGLGNAYAGGSASAEDATTVFYNPAGMTRLSDMEFIAGGHIIMPSAEFKNEGSTHVTGVPLLGGDGGDGGVTVFAPNLYFGSPLGESLSVGLGINSPFGLATEYDDSWVGRYHALESQVITVNINPSVAWKANKYLSFGAGVSAQYLDAELSNAIDFGTLDALNFGGIFLLTPQGDDGSVTLEGDSWGFGFNLGTLIEITENTRVGLAYRSRIRHDVEGTADFSGAPAGMVTATGGWFTDTDVEATVDLPDSASLSFYHLFNQQWAAMADITWTNWSVFDELRFEFDNGQPDGVTTEEWEDSYRYSLGISYYPSTQWTFRTGVAYDETPIPSSERRTPRIPTEDRIWAALGIGYKISQMISFDLGYAHLFVDDPEIDKDPVGEDALRGGLKGTYDASVDIISAQLNLAF